MSKFRAPKARFEVNGVIRSQLVELDTAPFRELLALMLSAYPDLDTLKHWAARNPDRMAQSIMNISRCAGLVGKEAPTPQSLTINFNGMSDSQILSMATNLQNELLAKGLPHIPSENIEAMLKPERMKVINE